MPDPTAAAPTISDTSPVQYLHQVGHLDLLPALYGRVTIPQAVADEIAEGQRRGVDLPDPSALTWADIAAATADTLTIATPELGPGEQAVLALAMQNAGALVILDDGPARRYAKLLGLKLTGTLGVLLKAKEVGHLPQIKPVIEALDRCGFRLDAATRAAVLSLAGE